MTLHMLIGYIGYMSSQKFEFIEWEKNGFSSLGGAWVASSGGGVSSTPGSLVVGWQWLKECTEPPKTWWRKKYEIIGKIRRRCFFIFCVPPRNFACFLFQRLFILTKKTNKLDLNKFWRCFWRIFSLFISGCCSVIRLNGKYFYFTFFLL